MSHARLHTGKTGEQLAVAFLTRERYRILESNWRCRAGEIDVIVEKDSALYFVEVKTRHSDRFGSPLLAVHAAKQRKLRRLAQIYLAGRGGFKARSYSEMCFACLGITWKDGAPHYDWLPKAFGL